MFRKTINSDQVISKDERDKKILRDIDSAFSEQQVPWIVLKMLLAAITILSFMPFNFHGYVMAGFMTAFFLKLVPILVPLYVIGYLVFVLFTQGSIFFAVSCLITSVLFVFLPKNPKELYRFSVAYSIALAIFYNFSNQIFGIIGLLVLMFIFFIEVENKRILIMIIPLTIMIFANFNFAPVTLILTPPVTLAEDGTYKPVKLPEENKRTEKENPGNSNFKVKSSTSKETAGQINRQKTDNTLYNMYLIANLSLVFILIAMYLINWKKEKDKVVNKGNSYFVPLIAFFSIFIFIVIPLAIYFYAAPEFEAVGSGGKAQNFGTLNMKQRENQVDGSGKTEVKSTDIKKKQDVSFYLITALGAQLAVLIIGIVVFAILIRKGRKDNEKTSDNNDAEEITEENIYKFDKIELIDKGYKYIRDKYFDRLFYLTPFELLRTKNHTEAFIKLTNLYVKKEYGLRNLTETKEEISQMISDSIEYYENEIRKKEAEIKV